MTDSITIPSRNHRPGPRSPGPDLREQMRAERDEEDAVAGLPSTSAASARQTSDGDDDDWEHEVMVAYSRNGESHRWVEQFVRMGFMLIPLHSVDDGMCSCGSRECEEKRSQGKHPRLSNGLNGATSDRRVIDRWLDRWPDMNVGARSGATPEGSGFFVVDIDPRHGGNESLAALIREFGDLPETVETVTGGGGTHFYFAYPTDGLPIRNRVDVRPGIDVRGDGGYIILPPSGHLSGNRYVYREGRGLGQIQIAEAPEWLLELVRPASMRTQSDQTATRPVVNRGAIERAVSSLLRLNVEDRSDGSRRLFAYACRCVECGLSDHDAIRAIRATEVIRPFPRVWSDEDILRRIRDAEERVTTSELCSLPEVILPGGTTRVTDTAAQLGALLDGGGQHFQRGGITVSMRDGKVDVVKTAAFPAIFEGVAALKSRDIKGNIIATVCTEKTAKVIVASPSFLAALPALNVISPTPVLVACGQDLRVIDGYDRETGIFAGGGPIPHMEYQDARGYLDVMLCDFDFPTEGDRARAVAAIVTPALVLGGLLSGRAPIMIAEADDSQAGKGFFFRLIVAIYSAKMDVITQRKGGVGSLEESLGNSLLKGAMFVTFDNWRGSLDCPALESALTEHSFACRVPYLGIASVDPSSTIFMLTSNGAELTRDMANRASIISIRKRPIDYQFVEHVEGDLSAHVKANSTGYLAAVFAIVRHWWEEGRPTLPTIGHDFRRWAGVLSWIVEDLGYGPLLQGHAQAAIRTANPALAWLRRLALAVERNGQLGVMLRAHQLLDVIVDAEILPDDFEGVDLGSEAGRNDALPRLGRLMARCFRQDNENEVDLGGGLTIRREDTRGDRHNGYQRVRHHQFLRTGDQLAGDRMGDRAAVCPVDDDDPAERGTAEPDPSDPSDPSS